jgi:hypothetical protein
MHQATRTSATSPVALALYAAGPLIALYLHGCASLSESECRDQDWYAIGFDDGYDGDPASQLAGHGEACAKYSITPDARQYEVGRRDGLVHYCTVTRGFEIGRDGYAYRGGCPPGSDHEFRRGHELGRRFHAVDQALVRVEGDLRLYRGQLNAADLDQDQQQRVYTRVRELDFERERLEADRRHLEWERQRL